MCMCVSLGVQVPWCTQRSEGNFVEWGLSIQLYTESNLGHEAFSESAEAFPGPKSLTLITWPQLSAKEARKHSLSSGWPYAHLKNLFHYYIRGAGSVLGKLPEMAICTWVSQTAPEECLTQPPAMGTQDSSQWETGSKVICLGFDSSAPFLGFLISKMDKITALASCGDRDEQTAESQQ